MGSYHHLKLLVTIVAVLGSWGTVRGKYGQVIGTWNPCRYVECTILCNPDEYDESDEGSMVEWVLNDLEAQTPNAAGYDYYDTNPPGSANPLIWGYGNCNTAFSKDGCANNIGAAHEHLTKGCAGRRGGQINVGNVILLRYEFYPFSYTTSKGSKVKV